MPSLYDISVPVLAKTLRTEVEILKIGAAWAADNGFATSEMIKWRLHEDMMPLWAQVLITVYQTNMVINDFTGSKIPMVNLTETSLDDLYAIVDETLKNLAAIGSSEKITAANESTVVSRRMGPTNCQLPLLESIYLYTLPNTYFHLTTLYDILRMKGVPLSKLDYINLFVKDVRKD